MKHPFIYTLTVCALLASCSSDPVADDAATEGRMPITLGVKTDGFTRFTESSYATLEDVGFYLTIWGDQGYLYDGMVEMDATDGQWKFQNASYLNSEGEIYWPQGTLHFRAIIGNAEMYNDPDEFYISPYQDVLVASAELSLTDSPNGTATLTFSHLLSQASVNLSLPANAMTSSVTVSQITMTHTTAVNRYRYTTGSWTQSTTDPVTYTLTRETVPGTALPTNDIILTPGEAVVLVSEDETSPFLIIPGTYTLEVTYRTAGANDDTTQKAELTFESGQSYNLSIPLPVPLRAY